MGLTFSRLRRSSRLRLPALFSAMLTGLALNLFGQQSPQIPLELQNKNSTVTTYADSTEKNGDLYELKGHVEVTYADTIVRADDVTYDSATGEIVAKGHVSYTALDAHLEADEAHYNVQTGKGWFLHGSGYIRPHMKPKAGAAQDSNPFYLQAKVVQRLNELAYKLTDGRVTSCKCEQTGWSIGAQHADIEVGDKVVARGTIFRFLRVPIFYAPVLIGSIKPRPRQSGLLLPNIGNSSQKGFTFGEGFYWAINRSSDLTLGLQNYSKRGLGGSAEFRARPSADSNLDVSVFGVNDRGSPGNRQLRAPGESIYATGEANHLWGGFRGVVDVDYANTLAFRETFTNNFTQAVTSEARQTGFLTKNFGAYSADFYLSRYQDFLSTTGGAGNSIAILHTPSFSFSGLDRQIRHTPAYFSFDTSIGAVQRSEPDFTTATLSERVNLHPEFTLRLKPFWHIHVTPSGGIWFTRYGTSLRADHGGLDRVLGDFSLEIRPPALERIFSRPFYGYLLKHVIEPEVTYRIAGATDPQNIMDVVRFDSLDTLSETNQIEYSLTNTVFIRKDVGPGAAKPQARELLSLRLSQIYYFDPTFGGALQPGRQIVYEPTSSLTGFAFATGRALSPLISVLKLAPSSNYDTELRADFAPNGGGVLNAGITSNVHRGLIGLSLTDFFISRTAAELVPVVPTGPLSQIPSYNLLRTVATYGNVDRKGFNGAFGVDYNLVEGVAHQVVSQFGYHFSCFAIDAEYRRFALGPLRQENEFRVAVSLTNVGSFGNLRRHDRLLY
jgi:LPS-assembly protein